MSDRYVSLNVIFSGEVKDEYTEPLIDAIKQLRGVIDVKLGPPMQSNDYAIKQQLRYELMPKIQQVIFGDK